MAPATEGGERRRSRLEKKGALVVQGLLGHSEDIIFCSERTQEPSTVFPRGETLSDLHFHGSSSLLWGEH